MPNRVESLLIPTVKKVNLPLVHSFSKTLSPVRLHFRLPTHQRSAFVPMQGLIVR